ncbi:phage portal protein [Micromonospora aurantiaca]|uniref:phage portal protein n=1 Tax=Micromonospora aurantiaca (nom. illeg.) TaxID=47850 RepID=UPI0034483F5F
MPLLRHLAPEQRRRRTMPALRGSGTTAGVTVTPEKALQMPAVYSCVRLLAETASMLPVDAFERRGIDRVPLTSDPAVRLVMYEPNPDMDAKEMWRTTVAYQGLRGNGLTYVQRARSGDPIGLWPIPPSAVQVRRADNGRLVYEVAEDDGDWYAPIAEKGRLVLAENMLHYRLFGLGATGLSPVGLVRQQIGTSYAAQAYIGEFFDRDASPGGVLSVAGTLTDDQYKRLDEQWNDLHEGFDRAHRLAILEGGARWEKISLSPADAQFMEIYRLGRTEIAGVYGVPPHMIGDVDKSTSWGSGIEQQSLGYVLYSLTPYLVRMESVTRRLFGSDFAKYWRWNINALVRGDLQTRYAAYAQGRQWGWLSANDVKRREDEDPIDGGDTYLTPVNMLPSGGAQPPNNRSGGRRRRAVPVIPAGAAMVALYPPADVAAALEVDGGLPAGELHVTLAYLGEDLSEQQREDAAAVVAGLARQHTALTGQLAGLGQFAAGEAGVPVFAPVDVPGLAELRHRLVDQLTAAGVPVAGDHGFTPHLTLTYAADGEQLPAPVPPTPVEFAALTFKVSGDRSAYAFTGQRARRDLSGPAEAEPGWRQRHVDALTGYLDEQASRIIAAAAAAGVRARRDATAASTEQAEQLQDWEAEASALEELLLPLALAMAAAVGAAAAAALGGVFTVSRVVGLLSANAAAVAATVTDTTRRRVATALADPDPTAALAALFGPEAIAARAELLADARTGYLTNASEHEGAWQAGARTKTWRTTSPDPRPSHRLMDGETVPINDRFSNNGRWPRDPDIAEVDEIAGCNCRLTYQREEQS